MKSESTLFHWPNFFPIREGCQKKIKKKVWSFAKPTSTKCKTCFGWGGEGSTQVVSLSPFSQFFLRLPLILALRDASASKKHFSIENPLFFSNEDTDWPPKCKSGQKCWPPRSRLMQHRAKIYADDWRTPRANRFQIQVRHEPRIRNFHYTPRCNIECIHYGRILLWFSINCNFHLYWN